MWGDVSPPLIIRMLRGRLYTHFACVKAEHGFYESNVCTLRCLCVKHEVVENSAKACHLPRAFLRQGTLGCAVQAVDGRNALIVSGLCVDDNDDEWCLLFSYISSDP